MTELEEKTERLARMLDENGLDAVILNAQHNFAWITCGGSNGVDLSRENGVASIIITRDGKRFVLANVIEIERMFSEEASGDDFAPIGYGWQDDPASVLGKVRSLVPGGANVATDIPMFGDSPAIEAKVAACRYSLTPDEKHRYRELGRDASDAMMSAVKEISPGQTELEIAETLRHRLAQLGITSVVTLVAADERIGSFRHPIPTANRWEKTLLLVTCARRGGLVASLSRMVSAGEPDGELMRRTEGAAQVHAALLNSTKPGVTGAELYRIAADAYATCGFAAEIDLHHQGGAAGYRTRDWVAHPASPEIVVADQAFAWNPSITGTKVEETGICSHDGFEVITRSEDAPLIETVVNGKTYYSPGIIVH